MTNIFCQSLGLSLHRGSTIINFIYLFKPRKGTKSTLVTFKGEYPRGLQESTKSSTQSISSLELSLNQGHPTAIFGKISVRKTI